MGDSEDEYDRRKNPRDKFRRERNDYDRREERRRDSWDHDSRRPTRSRDWSSRSRERHEGSYRDYDSRRHDRFSPQRNDMSPPQAKRMRRDWDDSYQPYDLPYNGPAPPPNHWGGGGPSPGEMGGGGMGHGHGQYGGHQSRDVDYPTQPAMMTFKQFLSQQDDNIDDQLAIKKYNEYKIEYKRQQISEFFLQHKEEEWFKLKYHPEESGKRKAELKFALEKRLQVFNELLESGRVGPIVLEIDRAEEIIKLLDAAVIKMEGGTDFDLTVLDIVEEKESSRSRNNSETVADKTSPNSKKETDEDKDKEKPMKMAITPEQEELQKKAQEFSKQQEEMAKKQKEEEKTKKRSKRHRDKPDYSFDSATESESASGSDSEPEPAPPGVDENQEKATPIVTSPDADNKTEKEDNPEGEEKEVDTKEEAEEEKDPKPRALHKTQSIFLRNLAPTITKQEIEAMCKRFPGFTRVALQDPQPERRFFRRGWVTFESGVNIKEICYSLNNIRLRDCELGATLNRDLKQRVRPVTVLTNHKAVVRKDIQTAAKIIQNLDHKWNLWPDPNAEKKDDEKEVEMNLMLSRNPVLKNITDYLVEEGSYEEEELLGQNTEEGPKEANPEIQIDKDENLIKALDKMILYLRIVHSIDFYSANEYPNEDEMPHRCGIMHGRLSIPVGKCTEQDVTDWISHFESKTEYLVKVNTKVNDEEAQKLGKKDPNAEVEKFIQSNCQELSKDKWLCPLSGKKFKGPEFIRKHILTKHNEKVEEVKQEVSFFNNYLMDPKRPQLPEHPGSKSSSGNRGDNQSVYQHHQPGMMGGYNQPRHMMYGGGGPPSHYGSQQYGGGGRDGRHDNYNNRRSGGYSNNRPYSRRSDPRSIIEYRDLDAPDDGDIF
ncbi:serrate RNA effector molecule homolog isoform X2 [Patella vulgata]|uniref:serrate RNA effector molecule homolog isoform X2 n=1 Tax=Patella vulgata TaxID=6465 RepID=UPI0021805B8C|nr:serrate RNA effector molecule homolog isoform X2 [Patella vulgata]